MKQYSIKDCISDKRIRKAIAILNKPLSHDCEELSSAANNALKLANTHKLAMETLKWLYDEDDLQMYIIEYLRFNVLKKELMYHTFDNFIAIKIQDLAQKCAGTNDRQMSTDFGSTDIVRG